MRFDITENDVIQQAKEGEYSLDDMINPSDIDEKAESWDDIESHELEKEINQSIDIMIQENWYPHPSSKLHIGYVEDLMYSMWRDSLRRISRDMVKEDISDKQLLVEYWVWPNNMDKWEITEMMYEYGEIPTEIENDGLEVLAKAYEQTLNPTYE